MRPLGIGAFWLALAIVAGSVVLGNPARAGLSLQEGTPAATTPAPTPAPATTDVVTIVAWYATDLSGDFLVILPLQTGPGSVAGPVEGAAPIGRADFPETGPVTITIGDSTFESYLRYAEDPDEGRRWIWFNEEPEARPATLVLQVTGLSGSYFNYNGTATFVSRDVGGVGGVLTLALRPPFPADGGGEAPATAAETPVDSPTDEAVQPDLTVEPGTDVLDQPDITPEPGEEIVAEPDVTVEPGSDVVDEDEDPPTEPEEGV